MNYYGNSFSKLQLDTEMQYWDLVKSKKIHNFPMDYITHVHDPLTLLDNSSSEDIGYTEELGEILIDGLLSTSPNKLLSAIDSQNFDLQVNTIPMFNNLHDGTIGICEYLNTVNQSNYVETGTYFTSEYNQIPARQKYGEEHLKLGALLGYVALRKPTGSRTMVGSITPLGKSALKLSRDSFEELNQILILRIDLIALLLKEAALSNIKVQKPMTELGMKESTITRRTQSVKVLIKSLNETSSSELRERISKIYW